MIEIYPNLLDGRACETATTERRMTIGQWLNSYLKKPFLKGDRLPVMIKVEGEIIDFEDWWTFVFLPKDHVEIRIMPKGTDPFSITVALVAGVKAAFNALMPKLPGTPNSPGSGDSLANASIKGNKVKLGDPIRESFGLARIYPDYLVPPHKYFSDYRAQQMELGLCVGQGEFQINADTVRIGDTQILALGDEAAYQLYEPGEYVGGSTWFQWWHTAQEVGASSTGAAGLELTATTSVTPSASAASFTFSGYTITIPSGAGTFPSDWTVGLNLRIVAPYTYTVTDGGGSARDVITGPLGMLNPTVGDSIEVAGTNAGRYTVVTYNAGVPSMTLDYDWGGPANNLVTGTGRASIGPAGLLFKIVAVSSSSLTVSRLDSSGGLDVSFPGFTATSVNDAVITVDSSGLEGGWRGPFPACPELEKTSHVQWDMFFPEGLCGVGQEGQIYQLSAYYTVQWRDMALGSAAGWNSIDYEHSNNTLDQGGATVDLVLPYAMRPEFRMRKRLPLGESLEYHDTIQWYGLKSLLAAPAYYAGVTCIGLRVQVSDRISSQTESLINVTGTRKLPLRQPAGDWSIPIATREIEPACVYLLKTLGYTDADIDGAEFNRLNTGIWRARGDQYNKAVTDETTAKDVLNEMLGAGFAEVTIDRGLVRPVRDEPRSAFEHMYTPQNFTQALSRVVTTPGPEDYDGVQVTYLDGRSWTEEVVDCQMPGEPVGIKIEKITAEGVTDRNKAYQLGMRRRRAQIFRRDSFSWATEMDALNSRYLSYCAVCDDVPGYGQSALLVEYSYGDDIVYLESSEPFDWSAAGTHMAALRRPDGTVSGPYVATYVDDYTFSIPSLDFVPDVEWTDAYDPPHIMFGPAQRWVYPVLVTSIDPNGTTSASVEGMGYDARVYLDDNSVAPD